MTYLRAMTPDRPAVSLAGAAPFDLAAEDVHRGRRRRYPCFVGADPDRSGTSSIIDVDGIAFGVLGDLCLLVYKVPPRYERMKRLYDHCDAFLSRVTQNGGTALTLQIVLPSSTPPDGPARAETRRRLVTIDPQVRRLVTVGVGDDVTTSMVRVLMRGIFMLSPYRATRFVTETVPRGVELLCADRSAVTPRKHEIVALVGRAFDVLHVGEAERALAFGNTFFRGADDARW